MNSPLDPRRIELLEPAVIEMMKSKTPAERLAMGFAAHRLVCLRLSGHFKTLNPDWTCEEIQAAVARRLLRGAV